MAGQLRLGSDFLKIGSNYLRIGALPSTPEPTWLSGSGPTGSTLNVSFTAPTLGADALLVMGVSNTSGSGTAPGSPAITSDLVWTLRGTIDTVEAIGTAFGGAGGSGVTAELYTAVLPSGSSGAINVSISSGGHDLTAEIDMLPPSFTAFVQEVDDEDIDPVNVTPAAGSGWLFLNGIYTTIDEAFSIVSGANGLLVWSNTVFTSITAHAPNDGSHVAVVVIEVA